MSSVLRLVSIGCVCALVARCGAMPQSSRRGAGESIAAQFAVLRTSSERLPPPLAHHIGQLLKMPDEFELVNTQLVVTRGGPIWVFLNDRKMCIVQANFGSISCAHKQLARSQGVVLGTFKPPSKKVPYMHQFLVLGVLPDGVRHVSATIGRNLQVRHVTIPVRHNTFAIAADQPVLVRGFEDR